MQEVMLTPESLPGFAHLIPEPLQQEVLAGQLMAFGALDLTQWDKMAAAVLLSRHSDAWTEIVWLAVDPFWKGQRVADTMLSWCEDRERSLRMTAGLFADLSQDDSLPALEKLFDRHGFSLEEVAYPTYCVTLDALQQLRLLDRPVSGRNILPLHQADAAMRSAMLEQMRHNIRAVPVERNMDWERYDPEISAVAIYAGSPVGALLLTRDGDSVTLELLWASQPYAVAQLLAFAAQRGRQLLPPETQVILPVITSVTQQMVERLLPEAQPQRVTQARLYFSGRTDEMEVE